MREGYIRMDRVGYWFWGLCVSVVFSRSLAKFYVVVGPLYCRQTCGVCVGAVLLHRLSGDRDRIVLSDKRTSEPSVKFRFAPEQNTSNNLFAKMFGWTF